MNYLNARTAEPPLLARLHATAFRTHGTRGPD